MPSASPSVPSGNLAEIQAIRALLARSGALRKAVLAEPVLAPTGAVVLEVRCGQTTAFRVVAPTAADAYALLHELITPLIDRAGPVRGTFVPPLAKLADRDGPLPVRFGFMPGRLARSGTGLDPTRPRPEGGSPPCSGGPSRSK